MIAAVIIILIFMSGFGAAIFLARRWNAAVGILGGLAVGLAGWAVASVAMLIWFVAG
ncbi:MULTISPECIES: hypothetical protein [unclassified Sphingobium]|uniref:hypothetical protein n=1 Tax=unclassified Sphingobium TaxID=2611147 RepID=UPI0035A5BA76